MPSIYEAVTAPAVAAYYNNRPQESEPFLLDAWFTPRKQLGTDLTYIKGARGQVKPIALSGYDAKAIPIPREGFEKVMGEIPFFKNSMNVNEKLRKELLNVMAANNNEQVQMVMNRIFDDQMRLLDAALIRCEQMRALALTTGKISFTSNGQTASYDFGVPGGNKVSSDWTNAQADPINDIIGWADTVENTYGTRPNAIIMNGKTFNGLKKLASIKNSIYVLGNGAVTPSNARVREWIASEAGVTIYIYNKGYTSSAGAFTKFIPDDTAILLPDAPVGGMNFAPTPEETDLIGSVAAENVSIVENGIAITTSKEVDPVNVMTKVSMCVLPSLEQAEKVVIASVGAL